MKIENDLLKSDIITNTTTNKSVLIDLYDKVILTYINTNRYKKNKKISKISSALGISDAKVMKSLKKLTELGVLSKTKLQIKGAIHSSEYELNNNFVYSSTAKDDFTYDVEFSIDKIINNTDFESALDYYVYVVLDENDNVIYVGKGSGDRYKHVISGRSHKKELNSLFIKGEVLKVLLFGDYDSEDESLYVEKQLIKKLKPAYNSLHV